MCKRSWPAYIRIMCATLSSPRSAWTPTRSRSDSGTLRQEPQVRASHRLEVGQRGFERRLVVAQPHRPGVLVVPGDHRTVVGEDQPQPPAADQFAVGQVLRDHGNRPFARAPPGVIASSAARRRGSTGSPPASPAGPAADRGPEQVEHRPGVIACFLDGSSRGVREDGHAFILYQRAAGRSGRATGAPIRPRQRRAATRVERVAPARLFTIRVKGPSGNMCAILAADASRRAALLVACIRPVCALLAPCRAGVLDAHG